MGKTNRGQKRVEKFPVIIDGKAVEKWGVLMIQDDFGERLISPPFGSRKEAVAWWEKNPTAGNG